jgi:hypothetical protein
MLMGGVAAGGWGGFDMGYLPKQDDKTSGAVVDRVLSCAQKTKPSTRAARRRLDRLHLARVAHADRRLHLEPSQGYEI